MIDFNSSKLIIKIKEILNIDGAVLAKFSSKIYITYIL